MSILENIDNLGDQAREFLEGMTPRDRALAGLMVSVVFLVVVFFGLSTINGSKAKARAAIADAAKAQAQVNLLLSDFVEVQEEIAALDARLVAGASVSPATWLEKLGNEMGISANIKGINEKGSTETDFYRAQTVDFIVNDIDIDTVVKIAHKVESSEAAMRIDELRVKTDRKDRSKLGLRMTISVLKPLGNAG